MISRQKLQAIKKMVKANGQLPQEQAQVLHSLIDHGLEALDVIDGGQAVIDHHQELRDAEKQTQLALKDVREALSRPGISIQRARYTLDMIDEMLGAKLRNRRQWSWYTARIDEEFGE